MNRNSSLSEKGFTLIELSISLLIIGLLAGGIVIAQQMIRASELRSVLKDRDGYITAINTFYTKYEALPGDFAKATSLWGAANSDFDLCKTTSSFGTKTCNGNNNGRIGRTDASAERYEWFRAWQHLTNAELLDGSFTGLAGADGTADADPGVNVPGSAIVRAGFTLMDAHKASGVVPWFDGFYGHVLVFGGNTTVETRGAVLTSKELYLLDEKIDDGFPGEGKVRSFNFSECVVDAQTYQPDSENASELSCSIIFLTDL